MTVPSVSILVPCYNAAAHLGTTLRSALARAEEVDGVVIDGEAIVGGVEILVWDDGSVDDSVAVARGFVDRGVRVLGDGVNRGGNFARQRLTEAAGGRWLKYLDADDALLPGTLGEQLDDAERSGADVVYAAPRQVGDDDPAWAVAVAGGGAAFVSRDTRLGEWPGPVLDRPGGDWGRTRPLAEPRVAANQPERPSGGEGSPIGLNEEAYAADVWVDFLRWRNLQTSSMLFRREAVLDAGGWKADQPRCQEHELSLRLLMRGCQFVAAPGTGALYRVNPAGVSRGNPVATAGTSLEVLRWAETHLVESGQMNRPRRRALVTRRLEIARTLWNHDRGAAERLHRLLGRSAVWHADPSAALPVGYRAMALALGLGGAERLAGWRR